MKIVWLKSAMLDLQEIRSYYRKKVGEDITNKLLKTIVKSGGILLEQPYIGKKYKVDNIYEWNIPKIPYVLPYRVENKQIQILRVFHTSQNRSNFWE